MSKRRLRTFLVLAALEGLARFVIVVAIAFVLAVGVVTLYHRVF